MPNNDDKTLIDPEHSEVPIIPLDESEPAAISAVSENAMLPNEATLLALKRLAGAEFLGQQFSPEEKRQALRRALSGEPFDPHALPEVKTMVLGLAYYLLQTGAGLEPLLNAMAAEPIVNDEP